MAARSSRLTLAGVLALALALGAPLAAEAKKAKTFSKQLALDAAIPPDAGAGPSTPLVSEIKVPKKFKKKVVGDVNVTAIQTTGTATGAAGELDAYLTAPNGRTLELFNSIGDVSIGPLTLDDDSPIALCDAPVGTACSVALASLPRPFAGTSNLLTTRAGNYTTGALSDFNGLSMRGTWTLRVVDLAGAANSTLNQWGLRIKPAKPVAE